MMFQVLHKAGRAILIWLFPAIRRLLEREVSLKQEIYETQGQLLEKEQQAGVLQGRLLEKEQQLGVSQGRLLEKEQQLKALQYRVNEMEQYVKELHERLHEAQKSNDRIARVNARNTRVEGELLHWQKLVGELEIAQVLMLDRLGDIAPVEESLNLLQPAGSPKSAGKCRLTIGIFGNTNNYPLLLAEGFRKLGHEVRLVVNSKSPIHRPESKYPEWEKSYPDWVLDCSAFSEEVIISNSASAPLFGKIVNLFFNKADLVVLNELGPSLSHLLPRPQVALLTGSDLAYYANFDTLRIRASMWAADFKRTPEGRRELHMWTGFVSNQRDGILGADLVCYGQRGLIPEGDRLLDDIGVTDERRMMLYLSNTINLKPQPPAENENIKILCGCRIVYRTQDHPSLSIMDFKGTDILLQGYALYCKQGGKGELRLPRKGQDIEAAVALINELGIGERVSWLEEMPLAGFYEEIIAADLICDQFGASYPGMVTADAYALGRPVMAHLRNEVFGKCFPEPLPGFDAKTPEQIANCLLRLENNRELLVDMGYKSRAYAENYLSPEAMAEQLLTKCGLENNF